MKHSIAFYISLSVLLMPASALAGEIGTIEKDKSFALDHLTPKLREACVTDFRQKGKPVNATSKLIFSEPLTRSVSTTLFWDNAQRGVAFLLPVTVADGRPAHIACFYGLHEKGLKFQMSQHIASAL